MTVALLSLITFLVLLLVTVDLGAMQEAQTAANTGGFQLQATVFGSQLGEYRDLAPRLQALQAHRMLGDDFAAIGLLRLMEDFPRSGAFMPRPPGYARTALVSSHAAAAGRGHAVPLQHDHAAVCPCARLRVGYRQVSDAVRDQARTSC